MVDTDFFGTLYGKMESGYLVVWEKLHRRSYYIDVKKISAELPPLVEALKNTADVYFGVGIQRSEPDSGRGLESNVCAIPGLWVDIDCAFGVHGATNLPSSLDEIHTLLKDVPTATFIINTGGGFHFYWAFDTPLTFTDTIEAKLLVKGFQAYIRAIFASNGYILDATHDLSRVLRVPGTYNHKTDIARPVIIESHGAVYSKEYLQLYTLEDKPVSIRPKTLASLSLVQAEKMLNHIPKKLAYTEWLNILIALYNEFGFDNALALAENWSTGYPGEIEEKLRSFENKDYTVTIGTLVYYARQYGWNPLDSIYPQIPTTYLQDNKYVQFDEYNDQLLLIKSQKGTGKTEQLCTIVAKAKAQGKKILLIGHRVALLRATAQRLGLDFYLTEEKITSSRALAISLDSLYKLPPKNNYDLIILDESEQVLNHATGNTLKSMRALCLNLLRAFLDSATQIIALDADLGRVTYNYFTRELPNKTITVLENTYKPRDKAFYMYSKKASFISALLDSVNKGEKLFIACNSKQAVKTLQHLLKVKNPEYLVYSVTSENSMNDDTQDFLSNLNISVSNYDCIIVSPSVGTGVSIDTVYFDKVYLLGEAGITSHLDLLQQAARVRNTLSQQVHVWVSDKQSNEVIEPLIIIENLLISAAYTAKELGVFLGVANNEFIVRSDDDTRYLALWADVEAYKNHSLNNLRAALIAQLYADEYPIILVADTDTDSISTVKQDYKDASNDVKEEWANCVAAAADIDYLEYAKLKKAHKTTVEQKHAALKFEIVQFYGIPVADVTSVLVLEDQKSLRRNIKNLALLMQGANKSIEVDLSEQLAGYLSPDKRHVISARDLRLTALKLCGADDLFTYKGEINPSNEFIEWAINNSARIASTLHIKVQSDIRKKPRKLIAAILLQLGITLSSKSFSVGKGVNRKITRKYTINEAVLSAMILIAEGYIKNNTTADSSEWVAANGGAPDSGRP